MYAQRRIRSEKWQFFVLTCKRDGYSDTLFSDLLIFSDSPAPDDVITEYDQGKQP